MDCSCDEFTAYMRVRLTAIGVNRSARPALTAQRKPLRIRAAADNATGTEAGLTDKKDLQGDILFKPFDEVPCF